VSLHTVTCFPDEQPLIYDQDFWDVYHTKLGFLSTVNEKDILIRTSNEIRTQHVASGLLYGMDHEMADRPFPVFAQPSSACPACFHSVGSIMILRLQIDSLVPSYSCPKANAIRNDYQSVPAWTDHLEQNADLMRRLGETLGTIGMDSWETWCTSAINFRYML
jgi:hypothetical protein